MGTEMLCDFISKNRDELLRRCRAKAAQRSAPRSEFAIAQGVSVFVDQLIEELRGKHSATHEISQSAIGHGHDLFLRGFTISDVVHDYGSVCQSITDLALELTAPIGTEDFRTLNRCLDDAIAGAVTEYSREQDVPREGEADQLRNLTNMAITAFEVLQTGNVGVIGSTGTMVYRNLMAIRAALASRTRGQVPSPVLEEQAIRR
jgi:hypothetical protein